MPHGLNEFQIIPKPKLARLGRLLCLLVLELLFIGSVSAQIVLPGLATNLICRYDFEHPVFGDAAREQDLGSSGTALNLINGAAAMRTNDGAYAGSALSLQTRQVNPAASGNDDWKAGGYQTNGMASLSAFGSVAGITLMGWVKPTGTNPNLNSGTPAPDDFYNAVGLFGLLSGTSEGHGVRALLEVINVSGTLRLVALGRRLDTGTSLTLAASDDWQALLPSHTWTHLTATFDFDNGTMALYRNGVLLAANYTTGGDPWSVLGGGEPDVTSATSPAGIKIGGSYPQNTQEFNAFNGRFDDLMFFNKPLAAAEVQAQFASFPPASPILSIGRSGGQLALAWPTSFTGYVLESKTNLASASWNPVNAPLLTNGSTISLTLPASGRQQFFRLRAP